MCAEYKNQKNIIYDNQLCGLRIGGWTNDEKTGVVCQCEVIKNNFSRGNPENDIILSKCDGILFQGNLFKNKKIAEKRSHMMMLSAGQKSEISCLNKRVS